MSTAIARRETTTPAFTEEQVELIKNQLAPGASDDELAVFLQVAQKHGLDPFAREVFLAVPLSPDGTRKIDQKTKQPKPATTIVARDGYLARADRHPAFDGMASGVVKEGDTFKFGIDEPEHVFGEQRGKIVGAYAYVYRSDRRRPTRFFAEWSEYGRPNTRDEEGNAKPWTTWSKYPSAMILKVAEATALKRAFSVSGTTAEGESPDVETVELPRDADERPALDVNATPDDGDAPALFPSGDGDGDEPAR